jgi:hypothetical protein
VQAHLMAPGQSRLPWTKGILSAWSSDCNPTNAIGLCRSSITLSN